MGEGDVVSEKPEPVANGSAEVEGEAETIMDKKGEHHDGVKEMEVDKQDDAKRDAQNMDADKDEVSKNKEIDENATKEGEEETAADKEKEESAADKEKEETTADREKEESAADKEKEETTADREKEETAAEREKEESAVNTKNEETEVDREKKDTSSEAEKEEINNEEREESAEEETNNMDEDKVEEKADGVKEEEENQEKPRTERESKKRSRTKDSAGQKNNKRRISKEKAEKAPRTPNQRKANEPKTSSDKKEETRTPVDKKEETRASIDEKDKEPKTPAASTLDRPIRERKSVERLVAAIEKESARDFHIAKGRGTALKDIPNVAYKLSRKKTDDTFKLLHTILFGRRGKAAQVKTNISRFSGFVWNDNEEKKMIKVKEKLDKFFKEKLMEFCDVLDIPISKAHVRKEDVIARLIEFLVEPHANSEQSSKGKTRKRVSKSSGSSTPSKDSAKSQKKSGSASKKGGESKVSPPESEDESGEEKDEGHEEEGVNGIPERSEDEMSEQAVSEEKESESEKESDDDKGKQKQLLSKSPGKKGSVSKAKTQKKTTSKKASPSPKNVTAKSKRSSNTSDKKPSNKKKDESDKKLSAPNNSAVKESLGNKVLKVKDKLKEEKLKPSDDKLRDAICELLKEVDFNTATFTDILKLLAERFNTDLTKRKSSVKLMIQEELTKLADADEADEEEDDGVGDAEKQNKAFTKGVKT